MILFISPIGWWVCGSIWPISSRITNDSASARNGAMGALWRSLAGRETGLKEHAERYFERKKGKVVAKTQPQSHPHSEPQTETENNPSGHVRNLGTVPF